MNRTLPISIQTCLMTACLFSASLSLAADESATWSHPQEIWLNAGFQSRHFDQSAHFRENNTGFGIEATYTASNAVVAGEFHNSDDQVSHYWGGVWKPLQVGPARIGLVAAMFNGYPRVNSGGWFPAIFPVMSLEYHMIGVNLILIPTIGDRLHGALSAQFKIRVW
ncbi:MAG: hypothetical protein JSR19_10975 [Proteobacteria bacterium]|nr:hypothetical protein [Pseudomonadota bacterium]HQR02564.1 hypothetical protein [Rhodocyclaceae bacterium]